MTYRSFCDSLLPGNYALSKSMELTKVQTSGTLWYMKKFLVLYYYVFLSNDLKTRAYIRKATRAFDDYIASLSPDVQEKAEAFFYPSDAAVDLRSASFLSFSNFASDNNFCDLAERESYLQRARKLYFALLMGSGGQAGIKKKTVEKIRTPGFRYSKAAIEKAIMDAAVEICAEQLAENGAIADNSVKYIFSENAVAEMTARAAAGPVTEACIREIVSERADHPLRFQAVENDIAAFLRNERQVMYYFGFFHSRSSGANDEFSSLTPVGEAALKANALEFSAIWEHQKLKMISQPPTADIQKIPPCGRSPENFHIGYTPYTDILGHLLRCGKLSIDEYKYIVSRRDRLTAEADWIACEREILGHVEDVKRIVDAFGRRNDIASDDARKELLKYLLGIRADLPLDAGTHPFGAAAFEHRNVLVRDEALLGTLYRVYSMLSEYKIARHRALFERCEGDLARRYRVALTGGDTAIDLHVKIDWDLYNIRLDKFILFGIVAAEAAISIGVDLFGERQNRIAAALLPVLTTNYRSLLKCVGIATNASRREALTLFVNALRTGDLSAALAEGREDRMEATAAYREASAEDLCKRIREISDRAAQTEIGDRIRSATLVNLMKSYLLAVYGEEGLLRCECCGEKTFLTNAGEPYLEFHHLIPFGIADGPDHYLNLFALCPNCHRKIHFLRIEEKAPLYGALDRNNYLRMELFDRLCKLKSARILRSYHLVFLLAEKAITEEQYERIAA